MRIVQDDIQQLTPAETDALRTMHERGVSRVWGYRSAPDGDHERYEAATHESSMLGLQRYTDPVFRSIDECYEDSKAARWNDAPPAVNGAATTALGDERLAYSATPLALATAGCWFST